MTPDDLPCATVPAPTQSVGGFIHVVCHGATGTGSIYCAAGQRANSLDPRNLEGLQWVADSTGGCNTLSAAHVGPDQSFPWKRLR
jgi:hypothetical protein